MKNIILTTIAFVIICLFVLIWNVTPMRGGSGTEEQGSAKELSEAEVECLHRVEITGHVLDFMVDQPKSEVVHFLKTFRTPVAEKNAVAHKMAEQPEAIEKITGQFDGLDRETKKAIVSSYMDNYRELRELCLK